MRGEWVGLEGMIEEVHRFERPPSFKTIGRLEAVLHNAFEDTQVKTHVITGSLKMSGRTSSDFDGREWTGTITYGGPSTGINNPVTYAIYEQVRGGEHDFYRDVDLFSPQYVEAIRAFFDGDR